MTLEYADFTFRMRRDDVLWCFMKLNAWNGFHEWQEK